nr:hypothetical protein [Pseudomonas sp. CMR5c]
MTAAGKPPTALARANAQTGFAHQSSNPVSSTRMPHGRQLGLDATTAIDPIHLIVGGADLPIRHLSRRRWSLLPGIVTLLLVLVLLFAQ